MINSSQKLCLGHKMWLRYDVRYYKTKAFLIFCIRSSEQESKLMCKNIYLILPWMLIASAQASPRPSCKQPYHTAPIQQLIAEASEEESPMVKILEKEFQNTAEKTKKKASELMKKAQEVDESKLNELLKKDLKQDGLIMAIVGALTLLYSAISDALLYPIFSLLFLIQTALLFLLGIQLAKKYREGDFLAQRKLLFATGLLVLIYFDLFMIVYEQRNILLLGLTLQKDIVIILAAAFLGFIRGKYTTKREFEEKLVP